jgi:hypothetical protein
MFSSRNLPFPKVIDPEAPPLRPERHVPNLDRHHATTPDCQARRHSVALPMLWSEVKAAFSPQVKGTITLQFMTQYN